VSLLATAPLGLRRASIDWSARSKNFGVCFRMSRSVDEGGRGQRVVGPLRAKSPARDLTQILVDNCDQPAVRGLVPPDLTPGCRPMSPFLAALRF
jgi:hypothetical protein